MNIEATPSATRDDKLAAITAACVKANPECERCRCHECDQDWTNRDECDDCQHTTERTKTAARPVRLADVLLARHKELLPVIAVNDAGYFLEIDPYDGNLTTCSRWNLRADSLDEQDDACVNFLHSLLS